MSDRYIIRTTGQTGPVDTTAQTQLAAHLADTSDAHDASAISFSATGNLSSPDVQAAIAELDTEKVPKSSTQAATSETLWSYTPDQAATPLPYSSKVTTQSFGSPSVTETNWGIGYGTFGGGGGGAGNISGYLKWLPNCGDTLALQWQFEGVFPGGGAYKGFEFQATNSGNDATKWVYRFTRGSDYAGSFTVNDEGASPYIIATTASSTAGNGNVQFPQKQMTVGANSNSGVIASFTPAAGATTMSLAAVGGNYGAALSLTSAGNGAATLSMDAGTGTGGAALTMNAASTGANAIHFKRAGSFTWSIYDAGSTTLYIRDQTNGVMALQLSPGSGTSGALVAGGSLKVSGNVGFYGTSPAAKPTVSGAKGSNAALGSLLTALSSLGLLTDSTSA